MIAPEKVIIGNAELWHGDCLDLMARLPDASVDSIVTDPPYGLGFMGHGWDHSVPNADFWQAMLRVAKPGSHLLAFGGSRTFHRMACFIEDAGWEVRDTIMWLYGSGFPKSHNGPWGGTALKPAHEPIILARKPLIGTVAANVGAYGTGALNIDACRISSTQAERDWQRATARPNAETKGFGGMHKPAGFEPSDLGRWPANVIHDGSDEVRACFPDAPGQQGDITGAEASTPGKNTYGEYGPRGRFTARLENTSTSAARFFYCAKASRADRNDGCEAMDEKPLLWSSGEKSPGTFQSDGMNRAAQNNHPTVKPTELMRYLCRLVTPSAGVVLDPFMGSGSTGRAAILEGFRFVGAEISADYIDIAKARIEASVAQYQDAQRQGRLIG